MVDALAAVEAVAVDSSVDEAALEEDDEEDDADSRINLHNTLCPASQSSF